MRKRPWRPVLSLFLDPDKIAGEITERVVESVLSYDQTSEPIEFAGRYPPKESSRQMSVLSHTADAASRPTGALEVYLLGVVDFDSALFLQNRLVEEISQRSDGGGALLLCEHPPLITVGREGSRSQILADTHDLRAMQIDVRWLNRGGGCLMHAPGQLAVYPIVPLKRLGLGLSAFRGALEQSVVDVCRSFRIPAVRRPEAPGVWTRRGQVAHIGAAVKFWVSHHGLFVNVAPSPDLLRMVASSPPAQRPTSLVAEDAGRVSMHALRALLIGRLAEHLGYERHHLYTGHPLLRRTTRKVYVHA